MVGSNFKAQDYNSYGEKKKSKEYGEEKIFLEIINLCDHGPVFPRLQRKDIATKARKYDN